MEGIGTDIDWLVKAGRGAVPSRGANCDVDGRFTAAVATLAELVIGARAVVRIVVVTGRVVYRVVGRVVGGARVVTFDCGSLKPVGA